MLFAIHMLDRPGGAALRAATGEAHRGYVRRNAHRMLLGGPLLAEDGTTMIGSLIVLECPDRAEAEAFVEAEPYRRAGLFESVLIRRFAAVVALDPAGPGKGKD